MPFLVTICPYKYRLSATVVQQGTFMKVLFAILKATNSCSNLALTMVALGLAHSTLTAPSPSLTHQGLTKKNHYF